MGSANRLWVVLPEIIRHNKATFLKGMSIMDNILLLQEIVRGHDREGGKSPCAIKLDVMKAYDSVDWERQCITNPKLSVVVNGELGGVLFRAKRIKAGGYYLPLPLSYSYPYLFLIVMEAFSSLLEHKLMHGRFSYHPWCEKILLTHLVFAGDLFIMSSAELQILPLYL